MQAPSGYDRVFFFGAGASKALGVPTTDEILPAILKALSRETLFDAKGRSREENRRARDELRSGLKKAFDLPAPTATEPPPVTDLFSLLDHVTIGRQSLATDLTPEDLTRLRQLLERATLWVLANASKREQDVARLAVRFYRQVVSAGPGTSCFITTNYDRNIENALLKALPDIVSRIDHGARWWRPDVDVMVGRPNSPAVGLFKLHGSVTWLVCPLCDRLYVRPDMSVYTVAYWDEKKDDNRCHCLCAPLRSVVAAPSLVAVPLGGNLNLIWSAALDALRHASQWVFVGYSLPNEDIAIRSMLLRAYRRKRRPEVHVVLKDGPEAPRIQGRYRFLFPGCKIRLDELKGYLKDFVSGNAVGSSDTAAGRRKAETVAAKTGPSGKKPSLINSKLQK